VAEILKTVVDIYSVGKGAAFDKVLSFGYEQYFSCCFFAG
jgi:hypothetical protein